MRKLTIPVVATVFLSPAAWSATSHLSPESGASVCPAGEDCAGDQPRGRAGLADAAPPTGLKADPMQMPKSRRKPGDAGGNLPEYLSGSRHVSTEGVAILTPEKVSGAPLPGLRGGDILQAELEQSIKASPSVPTPIRARVTAGRFRGAFLLGVATLDRELKRVLLTFERLRLRGSEGTYQLRATGLAPSGQVGIEGRHHTDEGGYYLAELGAATAAGFVDATTNRSASRFGTFQTEPSVANAAKQGAVQALSKSTERFAERARSAPEYTEVEGGRPIQIIVESDPREAEGQ